MDTLRVLVVDDEAEMASATKDLLAMLPMVTVHQATSAAEAFAAVCSKTPDVVVSDYHMPPENGDVFLAKVARDFPSVRRLIYSAASAAERARLHASGVAHAVFDKMNPLGLILLVGHMARSRSPAVAELSLPGIPRAPRRSGGT